MKLSKYYTIELSYKINYYHIPPGIHLDEKSDSAFKVKIKDKGYNLLYNKYLYSDKLIHIDASKWINGYNKKSVIPLNILLDALKNQKSISQIESINIDKLNLYFYKLSQKKVPVQSQIIWGLQKQFFISDEIKISPDSVWIFGEANDISKINAVTTNKTSIKGLKNSYFGQFSLYSFGNKNKIDISPSTTNIYTPIEEYTESTIKCKLNNSYNDEFDLKIFPNTINITFYVAVSKYKEIVDTNFTASIDFEQSMGENRALVKIDKQPKHVKIVKITPETVEFLKVKK